jgi:hypothetical protein
MEEQFLKKIVLKLVIQRILKNKIDLLTPRRTYQIQERNETITTPKIENNSLRKYSKEIETQNKIQPQRRVPLIQQRVIRTQTGLPPILRIPEPRFPPHLQNLNPIANKWEIDLEEINNLIRNPNIRLIECHGEEEPLIISDPNRKKTNIILTKEKIEKIIKIFSETTRIPIQEGINRIVLGNLILTAIISSVNSTKFLIKKLRVPQNNFKRF